VDAVSEAWSGVPLGNLCPRITKIEIDRTAKLKPGQVVDAALSATDPESDALIYRWVLRSDAGTVGTGGDFQEPEASFDAAVSAEGPAAEVTMPDRAGGYRLFAYVFDDAGGAAVANVPLQVVVLEPETATHDATPESR
jgi:hypothetical protein